jgi:hypothetical protein
MPSAREISDQVENFLAKQISLEQLEDWSAEYSWNIHQRADSDVRGLAYQIEAILNAYSGDSEDAIRKALEEAVHPFASRLVYAPAREPDVFGEPQQRSRSVNRVYQVMAATAA